MKAESLFYEWVATDCHLTRRVSGSVDRLWCAFHAFASKQKAQVTRTEWDELLQHNFVTEQGLVAGVCLQSDATAYQTAYAPSPEPAVTAQRRVKVNFLQREAA